MEMSKDKKANWIPYGIGCAIFFSLSNESIAEITT
jgi:hypothetical protein